MAAPVGHNSEAGATIARDELRLLIERVERIETEQHELGADKKDVYAA